MAGLITANLLSDSGIPCTVIEKREYPFHRVCGEYISNETVPFLRSLRLFPDGFDPPHIKRLQLTSVSGKMAELPLEPGGFGLSRFSFDHFLYHQAKSKGVGFSLNTEVESVHFSLNGFEVKTRNQTLFADVVIGSF